MTHRNVYVVDDEEPVRRSASILLRISGCQSLEFDGGQAFLDAVGRLQPGCVLLDMRMPGLDGTQVLGELRQRESRNPVIVMTGHGEIEAAVAALRGGAMHFLEKPFSRSSLTGALDIAFLALEQPAAFAERRASAAQLIEALGQEERAVLAGMADGRRTSQIASALGRSAAEIDLVRARMIERLNASSPTAALNFAFLAGAVPEG